MFGLDRASSSVPSPLLRPRALVRGFECALLRIVERGDPMSSRAALLMVGLIASLAWTSQASAAGHKSAATSAGPRMSTATGVPRLVDATPRKTSATAEAPKRRASSDTDATETKAKRKVSASKKAKSATKKKTAKRKTFKATRKASTEEKPKKRYVRERDRGLDAAAIYAPKTIERLRRNRTIERAEESQKGRSTGWRYYVDTYAGGL